MINNCCNLVLYVRRRHILRSVHVRTEKLGSVLSMSSAGRFLLSEGAGYELYRISLPPCGFPFESSCSSPAAILSGRFWYLWARRTRETCFCTTTVSQSARQVLPRDYPLPLCTQITPVRTVHTGCTPCRAFQHPTSSIHLMGTS